jgi:hypothetical protein
MSMFSRVWGHLSARFHAGASAVDQSSKVMPAFQTCKLCQRSYQVGLHWGIFEGTLVCHDCVIKMPSCRNGVSPADYQEGDCRCTMTICNGPRCPLVEALAECGLLSEDCRYLDSPERCYERFHQEEIANGRTTHPKPADKPPFNNKKDSL